MTEKEKDTKQKIKDAARTIFQQKGFAGAKTRDIADLAGINLALLNYHFKNKQNLFDIIMTETMQVFFGGVIKILDNRETSLEEKVEEFVNHYIDLLSVNINIPHFILNYVKENPAHYFEKIWSLDKAKNAYVSQQFMQAVMEGKVPPINPVHFLMNLMSLVVIPFLIQPMILTATQISQEQYKAIIEERRRLIPLWVNAMLSVK